MMLAHPVRREVRWRSALRRALSVVVRRSMESKIDQRMRIGELVYMNCRLRCFFMRETPRPSESPTFPPSLSARPPLQLSTLSPSTGRRRNPHNPDAHGPLSRQITEHLRDVMDVIAEDFGCR